MEFNTQPTPEENDHPALWDLVEQDVTKGLESAQPFADIYFQMINLASKIIILLELERGNLDITIEDALKKIADYGIERDKFGFDKYGVRLQAFNGRNFLEDSLEEALDLLVYFRGKMYEVEMNRKEKQDADD